MTASEGRRIRSFVVRQGKMTDLQRRSFETLMPKYSVPFADAALDRRAVFGREADLTIEIGFGMGEATWQIARDKPERDFLGIEVHVPGVGKLLSRLEEHELSNVRVIRHDAVEVLEHMVTDGTVQAFHIFFPDPWPKKRHHKRRLIQAPFAATLAEKLAPGGYIYCVTDWAEYADQMLEVLGRTRNLDNPFDGFATHQSWRPRTKFQEKGENWEHVIREVWFEKMGGA